MCVTASGKDYVTIRHLALNLVDLTHPRLTSLPEGSIQCWKDLEKLFNDNFQGTYDRPGNTWDLQLFIQREDEALREYIKHFS